jgi:pimeloyl-ACP methyl ester carboxylesterase
MTTTTANPATAATTGTVVSADGTRIAYSRVGQGPAVLVIDGALCFRGSGPSEKVAAALAAQYTVYTYDRRGRGASDDRTDLRTYDPQREIEDVAALVAEAGGTVSVLGISSGAMLAVLCAAQIPGITKAALYEAPFIVDDTRAPAPADYLAQLTTAVDDGKPGDAVKTFMRLVGMPGFLVALFPVFPGWSKMKKIAYTLCYDARIMGTTQSGAALPADGPWSALHIPTIVFGGGRSPQWMRNAAQALTAQIDGAEFLELPGQNHMIKAAVLAPALAEFFAK